MIQEDEVKAELEAMKAGVIDISPENSFHAFLR